MKIDPDQIYFSDEIKAWREICRANKPIQWKTSFILGWIFMMYISIYRRISCKIGKPCIGMLPNKLIKFFQRSYHEYIQWRLQKGTVAVSLSGVNLFYDNEWTIPFDKYNVNPPI